MTEWKIWCVTFLSHTRYLIGSSMASRVVFQPSQPWWSWFKVLMSGLTKICLSCWSPLICRGLSTLSSRSSWHRRSTDWELGALWVAGRVSFLTNRKYIVKIDKSKSQPYTSELGCPLGSVLAPLIFLLYLNDLPEYLTETDLFAYVDDISVVVSDAAADGLGRKLDRLIGEFTEWCIIRIGWWLILKRLCLSDLETYFIKTLIR